ncbi:EAL domain-containing protein [Paenibacillus sp. GCM10027628]|uniref:EAL domain-containing protein n=1 Tax=Paenibacillus sp. GCM10027628 TaxID=3273413 RepID=UPI003643B71D
MGSIHQYGVLLVGLSGRDNEMAKSLFERDSQFVVTGLAANGEEALACIAACRPDVVIVDLDMAEMGSLDTIHAIISHCPIPVVTLSANTAESSMHTIQAMRIGAVDYFHKDILFHEPASSEISAYFLQRCVIAIQNGLHGVYVPIANQQILKRMELEASLRRAIHQQEFHLVYQPIVDSHTGHIVGLECLIRWLHPQLGYVSPADFIPIAEETGLIHEIGEWVLKEACRQNYLWQNAGLPKLSVAVNLSSRQFKDSRLSKRVQKILEETGLPPQYLELEITESMSMDVKAASGALNELKKLGVKVAMDDFGTGYSSLGYLKDFPIDKMKIDQTFIKGLKHGHVNAAIVHTMIAMAHKLNLLVVAEGVETEEELQVLKECGCGLVQGYYFSPPADAEKIGEILHQYAAATRT